MISPPRSLRPPAARALSIQVESDNALKSLILSMILSEKSATFRDHALPVPVPRRGGLRLLDDGVAQRRRRTEHRQEVGGARHTRPLWALWSGWTGGARVTRGALRAHCARCSGHALRARCAGG